MKTLREMMVERVWNGFPEHKKRLESLSDEDLLAEVVQDAKDDGYQQGVWEKGD